MTDGRPFAWERSYPPGLAWDEPIRLSTLPRLLADAVSTYGPATAIEFRGRCISYDELGREAARVAAAFMRAGLRAGDPVALFLPNTPYHPIAFFGGTGIGLRLVHLSPLDAERELAFKLKDSGARILVTTNIAGMSERAANLAQAGLLDLLIVGEDEAWPAGGPPPAPVAEGPRVVTLRSFTAGAEPPAAWPELRPDDVALLQYTGGTTGMPKGAILSHGNITAAVAMYDAWTEPQEEARPGQDKIICCLPLFHIYALTTILIRGLKRGAQILLRGRFDVETTLRDIEVGRATHFPGVPTMWIALAAHPGIETRDLSSLVFAGSGGAPLPIEVGERFQRLTGHRLAGGWGMTETAPAGTNRLPKGPDKPGTIGLPLPGVELQVCSLSDPRRVLPPGETGELRIRGANVTRGYWNRPDDSRDAFVDGFFLTGDIGYMDEDGFFFIVDRKKDMIISGGFNVYPQMVEQAIYEHPAVEECLVVGVPDAYRGEAAKAFVKLRAGTEPITLEGLQAFLKDKVGRHEMPTLLEIRPALPRTAVGKLSKIELRAEERERAANAVHPHAEATGEAGPGGPCDRGGAFDAPPRRLDGDEGLLRGMTRG